VCVCVRVYTTCMRMWDNALALPYLDIHYKGTYRLALLQIELACFSSYSSVS
jgi:hypothetical protein